MRLIHIRNEGQRDTPGHKLSYFLPPLMQIWSHAIMTRKIPATFLLSITCLSTVAYAAAVTSPFKDNLLTKRVGLAEPAYCSLVPCR